MKTKLLLSVVVAAIGMLHGFAANARADDEADRAALRLIRTNYMEAVNSGDLAKIAPFLSKDVTGVMVTGQEVKGFDGLKDYWKQINQLIGPGGSYHVVLNVDKTDLYDGNLALSRGKTDDTLRLESGKELRFNSFWTAVCRKEDGAWKVIRMEASMNPVDNAFVNLRLLRARMVAGACGFLVGFILVLGLLTLRRTRRTVVAVKATQ